MLLCYDTEKATLTMHVSYLTFAGILDPLKVCVGSEESRVAP